MCSVTKNVIAEMHIGFRKITLIRNHLYAGNEEGLNELK